MMGTNPATGNCACRQPCFLLASMSLMCLDSCLCPRYASCIFSDIKKFQIQRPSALQTYRAPLVFSRVCNSCQASQSFLFIINGLCHTDASVTLTWQLLQSSKAVAAGSQKIRPGSMLLRCCWHSNTSTARRLCTGTSR